VSNNSFWLADFWSGFGRRQNACRTVRNRLKSNSTAKTPKFGWGSHLGGIIQNETGLFLLLVLNVLNGWLVIADKHVIGLRLLCL
jgi:hypothetical protein